MILKYCPTLIRPVARTLHWGVLFKEKWTSSAMHTTAYTLCSLMQLSNMVYAQPTFVRAQNCSFIEHCKNIQYIGRCQKCIISTCSETYNSLLFMQVILYCTTYRSSTYNNHCTGASTVQDLTYPSESRDQFLDNHVHVMPVDHLQLPR